MRFLNSPGLRCHCRFNGIDPIVGFARNVVNKYFDVSSFVLLLRGPLLMTDGRSFRGGCQIYFPLAQYTANEMRKKGSDRYVFMTQSWLVSLYLDCPPHMRLNCPSDQAKAAMIKALQAGDIVYHAYPFNAELEFMEESLLEFGFQVS